MLQHNGKIEDKISVKTESSSIATLIITTWKACGEIRRASKKDLFRDKVMYVTTLKEEVSILTR